MKMGVDLAYFAQDQLDVMDADRSVLQNLLAVDTKLGEAQARSILGQFLFRGDDVFKTVSVLSGGEKSRLGLARVLASSANFLLLDEPTNHLDMTSVEVLSAAIAAYEGSLMFVSHDRDFIDKACTRIFAMVGDGRSALFEGKLEDYIRMAKLSDFPNVLDLNDAKSQSKKKSDKPSKNKNTNAKKLRSLQKKLQACEREMESLKSQCAA